MPRTGVLVVLLAGVYLVRLRTMDTTVTQTITLAR